MDINPEITRALETDAPSRGGGNCSNCERNWTGLRPPCRHSMRARHAFARTRSGSGLADTFLPICTMACGEQFREAS